VENEKLESAIAFGGIGMMATAPTWIPQMIGAICLIVWVATTHVDVEHQKKRIEALERRLDENGIYE